MGNLRLCCEANGAQGDASTPQEHHAATIVAGIVAGNTVREAIEHAADLACAEQYPDGRPAVPADQLWPKAKFMFTVQQFVEAYNAGDFALPCVTDVPQCGVDCVS